ncbi:MAG: hypothetical protein M1825_006159 [Sarcosagium campestre]|nr:MAG: hypothetical protein M1825_006159 [Sarcosagium campestre]
MKILTAEEKRDHYNATLKGGIGGGLVGLAAGVGGVALAQARYPFFRSLTLPLKAFLATSAGTFAAIISADKYSREFEKARDSSNSYTDKSTEALKAARSAESFGKKTKDWFRENRYSIVGVSWLASMVTAFGLVGRNPYLSRQQKLVQARVYAQGLTLAVIVATAVFEIGDANKGEGRWETVQVLDPDDPEHKHLIEKKIHHERYAGEDLWKDMVDTEERKIEERKKAVKEQEERDHKAGKGGRERKGGKTPEKSSQTNESKEKENEEKPHVP